MTLHPCELHETLLLGECRVETYRASGPGGQKRNKTSSAVRITHVPTGTWATGADSRSQHDNRRHALRRLRLQLALQVRRELPPSAPLPLWWAEVIDSDGRLTVGPRSARYYSTVAHIFDVLEEMRGSLADASSCLRITTANLVDFLASDAHLWAAIQRLRQVHGLKPLLNPRKS